jgi:putative ABC transport system substrate-binding protein
MPVIGYLGPGSAQSDAFRVTGFRQGLKEVGYVEGQNLTIEYRWAEDHHDRLPTLAADLVRHQVAVIVATSATASLAAKAATTTLPIVFETAGDPVKLGFVSSLSRPGGNLTGVTQLGEEEAPKRLELLHELVPAARVMALLVNPVDALTQEQVRVSLAAAKTLGLCVISGNWTRGHLRCRNRETDAGFMCPNSPANVAASIARSCELRKPN